MVRLGGIAAFVYIAVAIIGAVVVGMAGGGIGRILVGLIGLVLILFFLWTTKGYMNSQSYSGADLPILIIIAGYVVVTVVSFFVGGAAQAGAAASAGAGAIIVQVINLVMFVAGIWFAIKCLGFGKTGGGIWKAIGILYLIGTGCMALFALLAVVAALTSSMGLVLGGGFLALIGGLVLLAAFVVHGIGLIISAGKMAA